MEGIHSFMNWLVQRLEIHWQLLLLHEKEGATRSKSLRLMAQWQENITLYKKLQGKQTKLNGQLHKEQLQCDQLLQHFQQMEEKKCQLGQNPENSAWLQLKVLQYQDELGLYWHELKQIEQRCQNIMDQVEQLNQQKEQTKKRLLQIFQEVEKIEQDVEDLNSEADKMLQVIKDSETQFQQIVAATGQTDVMNG